MRTTLNLDDRLLRQAKIKAAETGRTLTAVLEDALRLILSPAPASAAKPPIRMVTFKGKGLAPGISLDNIGALLDRLDVEDDKRRYGSSRR